MTDVRLLMGIDHHARMYALRYPMMVSEHAIGWMFLNPEDEAELRENGEREFIKNIPGKALWTYRGLIVMASDKVERGRAVCTKDRYALRPRERLN